MSKKPPGKLLPWVIFPTQWIQAKRLREFRWRSGQGADNAAALMCLIVLAHHANKETGEVELTYDQLSEFTSCSRAKVSAGLKILIEKKLVSRKADDRRSFTLTDYDPKQGWGKLPAKGLYSLGRVTFFSELKLRKPTELDALKLYLLFVARRSNATNFASISYDSIEIYTGIDRNRIKSGLSLLAANGVVHIEHPPSTKYDVGVSSAYRLVSLDSQTHMGTTGRRMSELEIAEKSM